MLSKVYVVSPYRCEASVGLCMNGNEVSSPQEVVCGNKSLPSLLVFEHGTSLHVADIMYLQYSFINGYQCVSTIYGTHKSAL